MIDYKKCGVTNFIEKINCMLILKYITTRGF